MRISTVAKTPVAKEELQDDKSVALYASLTSIDESIDGLVLHYKSLATDFPEYQQFFEGLSANMLEQKGKIAALRNDAVDGSDASYIEQGKDAAKSMLSSDGNYALPIDTPYIDHDEAIVSLLNDEMEQLSSIESATEDVEGGTTKEEIIAWLAEHEEAARDFVMFFDDRASFENGELITDDSLTAEEIEGWIYDHETLAEDYQNFFDGNQEEYIILAKESEGDDEGFLEYRYPDKLMAQGTFFGSQVPTALLKKENGVWKIEAMTAECSDYKELLEEQISLLNA